MKINPKIAKTPEDLKNLEFKKMKALIKKELKRLEKHTSAETPTQCILLGSFDYQDKPGMALPLFGTWKGKFKEYAKKEVVKNDAGIIGTAHYAGIGEDGQKVLQISIAKGKGKGKKTLFRKNLKKLIPQATYNVLFNELDEKAFDTMAERLESAPDIEENFEESDVEEVEDQLDYKKVLLSNFKEIKATLEEVREAIAQVKEKKLSKTEALDTAIDLDDLIFEWLEIYNTQITDLDKLALAAAHIEVIKAEAAAKKLLQRLYDPTLVGKQLDEILAITPTAIEPILIEGIQFQKQTGKTNCLNFAAAMINNYVASKGAPYLDVDEENGRYKSDKTGFMLVEQTDLKGEYYKISNNADKAIAYINNCLSKELPVLVGVSLVNFNGLDKGLSGLGGAKGDGRYNDGTTDHFIVIVGRFNNGGEPGYYYFDPAISLGADIKANQLLRSKNPKHAFTWHDASISWERAQKGYVLTRVLEYKLPIELMNPLDTENPVSGDIQSPVEKDADSADVALVQFLLNKQGANLNIDRRYGPNTQQAIIAFQTKNNITPADGKVAPGSETWYALKEETPTPINPEDIELNYHSSAKKLSPIAEATLRVLLTQAGERSVQIVNTYRSPEEQAKVLYANIKAIGAKANKKLYRNPAIAAKVIEAYEKALEKIPHQTEAIEIGLLLQGINLVGADKLSGHCDATNPAIDILPASIKNRAKFEAAIKKNTKISKFVAPPKDTTYHIELK